VPCISAYPTTYPQTFHGVPFSAPESVLEFVVFTLIFVFRKLLVGRDQFIEISPFHAVALVERPAHLDETLAALYRGVERVGAKAVGLALVRRADDHRDIGVIA
jgi:hypothetical protein